MVHWAISLAFLIAALLLTAVAGLTYANPDAVYENLHGHPHVPTGDWITDTMDGAIGLFPALMAAIFWGIFLTALFSC